MEKEHLEGRRKRKKEARTPSDDCVRENAW